MDTTGMEQAMRNIDVNDGGSSAGKARKGPRREAASDAVRDLGLSGADLMKMMLPKNAPTPVVLPLATSRTVNIHGAEIPVLNSLEVIERAKAELAADFSASGLSEREWRFWHRRGVRFAKLPAEHLREFRADVGDPKRRAKLVKASDHAAQKRAVAKELQRAREAAQRFAGHLATADLAQSIRVLRRPLPSDVAAGRADKKVAHR